METTLLQTLKTGIDIGSTTAKIAVLDENSNLIFSEYVRHNTKIYETVITLIKKASDKLGNLKTKITFTGSAGMGITENTKLPFIQEVIAGSEVIKQKYPEVKTLIDIGGEDSKMIFFFDNKSPDIRMNGSCAGGTGAFIDQTATLLNVSLSEFNVLASKHGKIYPIASRCGVFAKTDIQNLLSRKISKEDIAASVFHAVALQTQNTLARGYAINPKVMFAGGPFSFLPELTKTFINDLKLKESDVILSDNPELMPALGAALNNENFTILTFNEILELLTETEKKLLKTNHRLPSLFTSKEAFEEWKRNKVTIPVKKIKLSEYEGNNCFLGIDSGSTTSKITLIGENNELLFNFYTHNNGNPVETIKVGLRKLEKEINEILIPNNIKITRTAVTGYGEDLIKAAFGIDTGIVETIAHFEAAKYFNPQVSFIMDIGGQDMKAIFINNGIITGIELNEACSAGCGSFIENFGNSLGFKASEFAELACKAESPCDLGTRCTVFMNSKVKQSLRENAETSDIAAGLSVSVIKNALYKVLKIKDISVLGDNVVVQGGTFKNPSVQKALEDHIGRKVSCTDIPEQMGAFGAARVARSEFLIGNGLLKTSFISLSKLDSISDESTKQHLCKGCENYCTITNFEFNNDRKFYAGNKCEKIFNNKGLEVEKGINLFDEKLKIVFDRDFSSKIITKKKPLKIGIPRILNMFENFPFWNTLLTNCGFDVVLSSASTVSLYEKGKGTVMSDSICFPAKLAHGHIYDLIEKKVDRIFFPSVIFERNEFINAENIYNCPIVSSYSQVIQSSIDTKKHFSIPIDAPVINLNDNNLLKKACAKYCNQLGVGNSVFKKAFQLSLEELLNFRNKLNTLGKNTIKSVIEKNQMLVVLAGRPYHIDPLINQKTPDILSDMGINVIPEDMIPNPENDKLSDLHIITQWSYPNRIYNASQWVAEQPENVQLVQINSFGCGPDAIVIDECTEILRTAGKSLTLIRVDEISSTGSVRLRLRSMLESLKLRDINFILDKKNRVTTATFGIEDKRRTILAPYFADIYSEFIPVLFETAGYKLVNLPKPDKQSVDYGLKYANNEICYPATVIVGDVVKYLKEGNYNRDEIAIGITQTGGQCRASSYLALIKKAMISAGYEDIPVISVGTGGKTLNPQPGFEIDWKAVLPITFISMIFADSLAKMYRSIVVREKQKGKAKALLSIYIEKAKLHVLRQDKSALYELLKEAVVDFNKIEVNEGYFPKIGIVGEIYVKYNSFGHLYISEWLVEQGIEVVIPPILDFFTQEFVNIEVNRKSHLYNAQISDFYVLFLEQLANRHIRKANRILEKFKFYDPFHSIRHAARSASEIINLANQFGEGWLIPAEISAFTEQGIHNVVSVQPFGCIANHIISKGVEKRMKEKYPNLNLLFLDFDDGAGEVNILNRLHFMVKHVKERVEKKV